MSAKKTGKAARGMSYEQLIALPRWKRFKDEMERQVALLVAEDDKAEKQQQ